MHYFQFNIKSYQSATAHLSNAEDLAYRRLLDFYYDTEKPIKPTDNPSLCRRLRVGLNELETVLNEFFVLTENGWQHSYCDTEIAKYKSFLAKQRDNGSKGGRGNKANANPKKPKPLPKKPTAKPTNNQEPSNKEQLTNKESVTDDETSQRVHKNTHTHENENKNKKQGSGYDQTSLEINQNDHRLKNNGDYMETQAEEKTIEPEYVKSVLNESKALDSQRQDFEQIKKIQIKEDWMPDEVVLENALRLMGSGLTDDWKVSLVSWRANRMGKIFAERAAEQDLAAWIKKDILRQGVFDKTQPAAKFKTFESAAERRKRAGQEAMQRALDEREQRKFDAAIDIDAEFSEPKNSLT
jgi:uncharacterized protein YdaU (DUF1376 family)